MNYQVFLGEKALPIYTTTVLPVPYNETKKAEFITLKLTEETVLKIVSEISVTSAVVRPLSAGIVPQIVDEHTILLCMDCPKNISLEINGTMYDNLCIFASPERKYDFDVNSPNVYYYPAGEYDIDKLVIHGDNIVFFMDEGAHLTGKLEFNDCHGLYVCGTGRIECDKYTDNRHRVCLDLVSVTDAKIEDICVLDSTFWCVRLVGCDRVHIDNIKIIGYRGNSDGVDVCGSRHILVENIFTRVHDDSLVVKGIDQSDKNNIHFNYTDTDSDFSAGFRTVGNMYDLHFRNCVLWNDFARPMELGVSLRTDEIKDVHFENIDIIHSTTGYPLMGIHHGDRADVHDVLFEKIRIEDTPGAQLFDLRMTNSVWSTDAKKGSIHDFSFKDITLLGKPGLDVLPVRSRLEGYSEENSIRNISFENICLLGKYATTPEECNIDVRDFVSNVSFRVTAEGERIHPLASKLEIIQPFEWNAQGKYSGKVKLTVENTGMQPVAGKLWLDVAPKNMADTREKLPYELQPGEVFSKEYSLTLQAGKYLMTVGSNIIDVPCDWKLLTLDGRTEGFTCDFVNYYNDRLGSVDICVKDNMLCIQPMLTEQKEQQLVIYAAKKPQRFTGEMLFSAEETDFGECNAVIYGVHGEELAPQIRCPQEITYVFLNQPKVEEIVCYEASVGKEKICIPLRDLHLLPGEPFLLEIELKNTAVQKYRYPYTLFHSVLPKETAHMFLTVK